jgi:hypothetical protein
MSDDKNFWAGTHKEGWQVKREGNERASSVHPTQADAWAEAQNRAKQSGGEAFKQKRNGQIGERNTYGHDPRKYKG